MTVIYRVSGKKVSLGGGPSNTWKFTKRPGGWVVAESPDGHRIRFAAQESKGELSASIGGKLWFGKITEKSRQSAGSAGSDSDLISQFPGKVRKVLVELGAMVSEGDPLVLVEAMKMEFVIKAPFQGKVIQVLVKDGQQLAPGDRFLFLEAAPANENGK